MERQPFINWSSGIEVTTLAIMLSVLIFLMVLILTGAVDEYKDHKRRKQIRSRMAIRWVLCRFELYK
jgi:hypothetical protein